MERYGAAMPIFLSELAGNASSQDSVWARLLTAGLPSVFAIVLAWMVFSWNQRKDDRRWVLENKKVEWQTLLELAARIEEFMPAVAVGSELTKTVHDPLFLEHLRFMTRATLKCVFISLKTAESIYTSLLRVQLVNEESKGHIEDYGANAGLAHSLGKPRPLEAAKNVQLELIKLWREIRTFAAEDLDLEQHDAYWKFPLVWQVKRRARRSGSEPQGPQ